MEPLQETLALLTINQHKSMLCDFSIVSLKPIRSMLPSADHERVQIFINTSDSSASVLGTCYDSGNDAVPVCWPLCSLLLETVGKIPEVSRYQNPESSVVLVDEEKLASTQRLLTKYHLSCGLQNTFPNAQKCRLKITREWSSRISHDVGALAFNTHFKQYFRHLKQSC